MFGGITALFSGLAFAGLIYTMLMQKKELELQREDLSLTRAELEGQKIQLESQNKTMIDQIAVNTIFNLLRLQKDIKNNLKVAYDTKVGVDLFKNWHTELLNKYQGVKRDNKEADDLETIRLAFDPLYNDKYRQFVSNYFSNIEMTLSYIVNTISKEHQHYYASLFKSQLTEIELCFVFYYGISKWGEKLKPLAEHISLFSELDNTELLNPIHRKLYDEDGTSWYV